MITLYSIVKSHSGQLLLINEHNNFHSILTKIQSDSTIIIGRKIWFSIPQSIRASIKNDIIVFTQDKSIINDKHTIKKNIKFMDSKTFFKNEIKKMINYVILGGQTIYKLFIEHKCIDEILLLYKNNDDKNLPNITLPENTFNNFEVKNISKLNEKEYVFELRKNSDKEAIQNKPKSKFKSVFKLQNNKNQNSNNVMSTNIDNSNRERISSFYNHFLKTGFRSNEYIKNFGMSIHLDIDKSFPVFTDNIDWYDCINKLLWDIQGNTREGGVNIGWEWRFFGAKYSRSFSDVKRIDTSLIGGYDQIKSILKNINTQNDQNNSLVLNSWDLQNKKLPPRNHFIQFYVSNSAELHCHIYSCKLNLETQFQHDILYYSTLLSILSKKSNLTPKTITFSYGEIYTQISNLSTTIKSNFREMSVILKESIKNKDFIEMTSSDFTPIFFK